MKLCAIAAGALSLFLATSAHAITYSFEDPGVAKGTVNLTTGVVTLTSEIADPGSAADEISGVVLTFDSLPNPLSLISQAGQLLNITITGHGPTKTITATDVAGDPTRWHLENQTSTQVTLLALGGGQPSNMIIGSGPYTQANASIPNFNDHIQGTGTFHLDGLNDNLTLLTVLFLYGTGPDTSTLTTASCGPVGSSCAPPPIVPVPGALPLFVSGLAGLGWLARRRRKAAA